MNLKSRFAFLAAAFGWSVPAAPDRLASRPAVFNMRLWFGVAAFLIIGTMGFVFALMLTSFLSTQMLRREAVVTRDFLESVVWAESSAHLVFSGEGIETNPQLESFVRHIQTTPDIVRANVYRMDGHIVWSTNKAMINQRFAVNHELDEAFRGVLGTEIGTVSADTKAEHAGLEMGAGKTFVEAYMPIRDRKGAVRGVVELYKIPNALNATIAQGQMMIWASVSCGMLVLFLSLFWIVRRGAALIQRQQAELGNMAALAALGQMASAIAHSLRNPLSGIRTSAELLRLESGSANEAATDIIGEVDRLDTYVRELLDYVRSEGQTAQTVDPLDVVREVLARLRPALTRASTAVTVTDDRPRPLMARVDPQLLAQACGNVITNAIEAMGPGGSLSITAAQAERHMTITIADTGPGIPLDIRRRVSEPFFTTKTRGLGLGLALSRQIMERFGGALDIGCADTGGAVVRLTLPVTQGDQS